MKSPNREEVTRLEDLPNVGPAIARALGLVGIETPSELRGRDGVALYTELCEGTSQRYDPCVCDTFMAAVDYMEGGEARPWWSFTSERKRRLVSESRGELGRRRSP